MKRKWITSAVALIITVTSCVPVYATLVNEKSPFTDETDGGGTEDVNLIGTGEGQQDAFVNVVKGYVNRVLAVLALIALIILLYGGFLMVTSAGDDDKYNKGFTILKHAAIGLIMIGVAWFVISIVFWLVNVTSSGAGPAGTEQ